MKTDSRSHAAAEDAGLGIILDSFLESIHLENPDLAQAVLYCSIPRWFDREVAAGMCTEGAVSSSVRDEVYQRLLSLTFCEPHPTRVETWKFRKEFRSYFLTRSELTDCWEELHARAAETFKRMLDSIGLHGDNRFQDDDWLLVVVEWLYHLLHVDHEAGLAELTKLCAEALAVPVYQGPSWEIDFCVRLLADLEWPSGVESLDLAIGDLRKGFGYLAAGQNAKALAMVKHLADVPGLAPEQAGELHYFAGTTHLYDEGKMGPALEELGKAAELIPNRAGVHAEIAAVHCRPGTTWGRLDLAEESAREAIRVEPEQAEGHVARGSICAIREDWEQAIAHYKRGIEVEPDDTEGYLALSEVYAVRREAAQAIELIDKAWEISPGREYYASIRRGDVYASARDFERARREYETAITLGPDQPVTYVALGRFHEQIDELSEAAEMYGKAIELDPTIEDGYVALAALYGRQGRLQKAIGLCQRCLTSGAIGKAVYIMLSDLYQQQERLADLEEVQEKIVALDSAERYASYCAMASALLNKTWRRRGAQEQASLLARARQRLEKAIELDKNRAWAYLAKGELYILSGDYNQLGEIERLVAAHTPWAVYELLVELGRACLRDYQDTRSEKFLNRAVELAPQRVAAWQALGELYAWRGDPPGVARVWGKAVQIDPALRYDAHIVLGDAYYHIGDYRRARQEYSEAVELEPNTAQGYLSLGVVAEDEGDPDEATEEYRAAAEKASGLAPVALSTIARLHREQKRFHEAEKTLRRAIVLAPDRSEAYLELARLGAVCDRQALVTEASERIASTFPDQLYDLYSALGDAYRSVGRFDDARKAFEQCRERDPDRADAYIGMAQILMDQEQWPDVHREVTKAIEVDRTAIGAYVISSRVYEAEKVVEGVISAQRRIVELAPTERYNANINTGRVYEAVEQVASAEQQYREALALCPWRPDAYIVLGLLLTRLERSEEVEELFEKAKAEANIGYLDLGLYLVQEGRFDDALKVYSIGMKNEPPEAQVDLCLASAQLRDQLGQPNEAERDLQQAIALDPMRPEGYVALMYLLAAQGRLDDAVQVCHRMAEQPQLAYDAYVSLGNLLVEGEEYEEAEQAYRQAIGVAPGKSDAYGQLGQLLVIQGRPDDAGRLYRQMAKQPELTWIARLLLGDLWVSLEKYKEAERAYRQAIKADRQQPAGYLRLAPLYQRRGELSKAEKLIQDAMQVAPDSPDPYFVLAQLREQQDRVDDAVELYRRVAALQPDAASAAYERIGDLLIDKERYDEAVPVLQQAVQKDPANAGAYFSLGTIYERQADLEQATAMYSEAIKANPEYLDAYVALGRIYGQQGNKQALESVVQQLVNLDFEQAQYEASLTAAELYRAMDETTSAEAEYERAIALDRQRPEGYVALVYLLAAQERVPDAVQVCHRMAEQPQLAYDATVLLGNLLAEGEEYEEAERAYRQAIGVAPGEPDAYEQLGQLLVIQERPDDAERLYRQMAEQPGIAWIARLLLGDLWVSLEKHREAERAYQQAIKADRQQPAGYLRLAQLREQQDRVDDAIELYRRVAAMQPDAASAAYERIGDLLIDKERYDEAVPALQQAVHKDPANAGAYFSLGTIYERQADLEQATAMYSDAIEADPKYFYAYIALGRIYGQHREVARIAQLAEQLLAQNLQPTELYDAHMAIGGAYQEAQALEWAMDEFRTARDLDPARTEAYLALAQIYETQMRWADARGVYEKLGALVPEWQPDVHRKLGDLYVLEGASSEAEQEYHEVIRLAPERWEGYYALAQFYMTRELWLKAAETWEQLTRLKDIDPVATCNGYLYLAGVRRTLGDIKGMLAACSQAISLVQAIASPDSGLLRLKGLALFIQGKYDEASTPLQLCLEAEPGDVRAHFYLALNLLCQGNRAEADHRLEQGLACVKDGSEFDSAIREAKVLAARTPEVAGAKEMLETLTKAAADATR